jgi:beta-galactosidase
MMKAAGFKVVRMGDLSWDAFEPAEGIYTFDWFDRIMDQMHAAGIKVLLDISGLPAPMWLHHAYPGVNVVNQNGVMLQPAERYMEDIGDPDYRRLVKQFADTLTRRYAHHPALLAIGYDNEIGNGFMSYSAADRERFVAWLKARYGTLDALNQAWATQRWSRRLDSWDEVELPYADGPGPPERYLDLHRFWSEQTIDALRDLEAIRRKNIPDKPAISNLWDFSPRKGFDYLASYRDYVSYGAMGFYPGDPLSASFDARMMKGALDTPIWFNEFTAGGGGYYGTKGRSRMWAYMGLIDGAQAVMAWTFNSHQGGEEQALFGLVDHDGAPSWKLGEFAQIASEFGKLEKLGFPRMQKPQVAIAYSFESNLASNPNGPSNTVRAYIKVPYTDQVLGAYEPFLNDNIDAAIINVGYENLSEYKLIVVAGDYIMDEASARALRAYVMGGGTVIMTAYSAKADEHAQWFETPLPGRLDDVFGVTTNAFYDSDKPLVVTVGGQAAHAKFNMYEVLAPTTAEPLARLETAPDAPVVITRNRYGKGTAIYVGLPAQASVLGPLVRSLYGTLHIGTGPATPPGVFARVVDGRTLYVNTTTEDREISIQGSKTGVITGKTYLGAVRLPPYGVDLVEETAR